MAPLPNTATVVFERSIKGAELESFIARADLRFKGEVEISGGHHSSRLEPGRRYQVLIITSNLSDGSEKASAAALAKEFDGSVIIAPTLTLVPEPLKGRW